MSLTLRNVKGSPLTYNEMDNNLTYLEGLVTTGLTSSYLPLSGGALTGTLTAQTIEVSTGYQMKTSSSVADGDSIAWGNTNTATGITSVAIGGSDNKAIENSSATIGGKNNIAGGINSSIIGGVYNTASANFSSIIGGFKNNITNYSISSGIFAGTSNIISGASGQESAIVASSSCVINNSPASFIAAGYGNTTNGSARSSIIGGFYNNVFTNSNNSFIGGGQYNEISYGYNASVIAGQNNKASANYSIVAGGDGNEVIGTRASVISGQLNVNRGDDSSILAGRDNTISLTNQYSSIIAGDSNTVNANRTVIIGGKNITATVDDSVYVPNLNIGSLTATKAVTPIALDANGFVVDGTSLITGNTLANTLSIGNETDGNNINITNGDKIISDDGGTIIIEAADSGTGDSSFLNVETSYIGLISLHNAAPKEDGLELDPAANKNGTRFYSHDFTAEQLSQVSFLPQTVLIQTLDSNNAVYNAGIATSFLPAFGPFNDSIRFGLFAQNSAGAGAASIQGNVDLLTDESVITLSADVIQLNLPTYADNAAAIAGRLPTDAVYKTSTGELRIVI